MKLGPSFTKRFWSKVRITDQCWHWKGAKNRRGYGVIQLGGRKEGTILAHRASWILKYGPVPVGVEVCHKCPGGDNPSCVNPLHLWLGTHADNMSDASKKLRFPRGESHYNRVLTRAYVDAMRRRWALGMGYGAIAKEFRCGRSTVRDAVKRITWKETNAST